MSTSVGITPSKDAQIKVLELSTEEEVIAFLEGEHRKGVVDTANKRLKELGSETVIEAGPAPEKPPKEGQSGKMTDARDAKGGGIEGRKSTDPFDDPDKKVFTGEDVLEKRKHDKRNPPKEAGEK